MTVCLVVLGRHVPQLQFLDVVLGNEPALTPEETFYQRMLANDPEEATQQAEEFASQNSIAEFFDKVAVPALTRAQADSNRGALPPERRRVLTESFKRMLENLSETSDEGSPAAEQSPRPELDHAPAIVCVAGRNELDEAAALCLAHLLRLECRAGELQTLSADALGSDNLYLMPLRNADLLCLSLISTGSAARARYLVRRVRRRAPRAKIIVGFWGSAAATLPTAETAAATSADAVAFSLREVIPEVEAQLSNENRTARAG